MIQKVKIVLKISKEVLYRCKYNNSQEWIFLCGKCLNQIKSEYHDTYRYGGTWKSKKSKT